MYLLVYCLSLIRSNFDQYSLRPIFILHFSQPGFSGVATDWSTEYLVVLFASREKNRLSNYLQCYVVLRVLRSNNCIDTLYTYVMTKAVQIISFLAGFLMTLTTFQEGKLVFNNTSLFAEKSQQSKATDTNTVPPATAVVGLEVNVKKPRVVIGGVGSTLDSSLPFIRRSIRNVLKDFDLAGMVFFWILLPKFNLVAAPGWMDNWVWRRQNPHPFWSPWPKHDGS